MPEDGITGFDFFRDILDGGNGLPGPSLPTLPPGRSLEELVGDFFGTLPDGSGGLPSEPPSPARLLEELLTAFRDGFPDGPFPSFPDNLPSLPSPTVPPSVEEILDEFLLDWQPLVERVTAPVVEAKTDPEWEGNVPPDLTDGFDFLL